MTGLSILQFLILFSLALLHFFWALGGRWAFEGALPSKPNGEKLFRPERFDCAMVGIGLTALSSFYLIDSSLVPSILPAWFTNFIGWAIPVIFLLRAIGEFNYVGFFKKVKGTDFARLDTIVYAPLCLIIALFGFAIAIIG